MKPAFRRWAVIAALIIVPMFGAGFLSTLKPEPPKKDEVKLAPLVDVLELVLAPEVFTVRSQGTVRPRTETVLSSEVSGAIVEISPKFIAGGVFGKGEVLMRIDPTNYTVAVDQAKALVRQRQIEFDGAEKLLSQGYRAEAEHASAAAALASAKAELVRANRNFERTYIRLPYAGMVRSKNADLGQFVNPGTTLGVTFATDIAEVRLPLTDQDLAFVTLPEAGAQAGPEGEDGLAVTLSAIRRGQPASWDALIVRSEGVVDERSRVTYAVARIDDPYRLQNEGAPLPIGTFVAAEIKGQSPVDTIRVPRSALRGSDELVFLTDENKIELRRVEILRTDADFAYVSSGAAVGERISVTTLEAPINGMTVRSTDRPDEEEDNAADQLAMEAEEATQ